MDLIRALLGLILVQSAVIYVEPRHLSRPRTVMYQTNSRRTRLPSSILSSGSRINPAHSIIGRQSWSRQLRRTPYRHSGSNRRNSIRTIDAVTSSWFSRRAPFRISASPAFEGSGRVNLPARSSTRTFRLGARTNPIRIPSLQTRQLLRYARTRPILSSVPGTRTRMRQQRSGLLSQQRLGNFRQQRLRQVRQQRPQQVRQHRQSGARETTWYGSQTLQQRLRSPGGSNRLILTHNDSKSKSGITHFTTNIQGSAQNGLMHVNIRQNTAGSSVKISSPYTSATRRNKQSLHRQAIGKVESDRINANLRRMSELEKVLRHAADVVKQRALSHKNQSRGFSKDGERAISTASLNQYPGSVFRSELDYPDADVPDSAEKPEQSDVNTDSKNDVPLKRHIIEGMNIETFSISVGGVPIFKTISQEESVVPSHSHGKVGISSNNATTEDSEPVSVAAVNAVAEVLDVEPAKTIEIIDTVAPINDANAEETASAGKDVVLKEILVPIKETLLVETVDPVRDVVPNENLVQKETFVPVKETLSADTVVSVKGVVPKEIIVPIAETILVDTVDPAKDNVLLETVIEETLPPKTVVPVKDIVLNETIVPIKETFTVETIVPVKGVDSQETIASIQETLPVQTNASTLPAKKSSIMKKIVFPVKDILPAAETVVTSTVTEDTAIETAKSVTNIALKDIVVPVKDVLRAITVVPKQESEVIVDTSFESSAAVKDVAAKETTDILKNVAPVETAVPVKQVETIIKSDVHVDKSVETTVPVKDVASKKSAKDNLPAETYSQAKDVRQAETFVKSEVTVDATIETTVSVNDAAPVDSAVQVKDVVPPEAVVKSEPTTGISVETAVPGKDIVRKQTAVPVKDIVHKETVTVVPVKDNILKENIADSGVIVDSAPVVGNI